MCVIESCAGHATRSLDLVRYERTQRQMDVLVLVIPDSEVERSYSYWSVHPFQQSSTFLSGVIFRVDEKNARFTYSCVPEAASSKALLRSIALCHPASAVLVWHSSRLIFVFVPSSDAIPL
jgi:hypothetical protein